METISLFKEEGDRKFFGEVEKRIERYGTFKFFRFFLEIWATIYITVQILVIVAGKLGHFSIRLYPDMTMTDAVQIGITVSLWSAGITGLLALVGALIIKLKRQERDRDDLKYLSEAYSGGQIERLYQIASTRLKQVNDLKIVAEGLDETELELIRKATRASNFFSQFESEVAKAWKVFLGTTKLLRVTPFVLPTTVVA